jgi:hypothetical protein
MPGGRTASFAAAGAAYVAAVKVVVVAAPLFGGWILVEGCNGPNAADRWAEGGGATPPPLIAADVVLPRRPLNRLVPQPSAGSTAIC